MIYLEWQKSSVHYLTCSYQELVKAFGQGSSNFDTDKQFAQWNIDTSNGVVEIYDYGYADSGDYDVELLEKMGRPFYEVTLTCQIDTDTGDVVILKAS